MRIPTTPVSWIAAVIRQRCQYSGSTLSVLGVFTGAGPARGGRPRPHFAALCSSWNDPADTWFPPLEHLRLNHAWPAGP
jgi:hypothetical protein